ncbi:MAG: hypothetical protein WC959_05540 [Kiritimatiellales bacterium]
MTEEQKEMFRDAILQILFGTRHIGMRVPYIRKNLIRFGFPDVDETELRKHLRYLIANKMVEVAEKELSLSVEIFLITEAGVAYLDESGLAN